jgi:hypothetical protein
MSNRFIQILEALFHHYQEHLMLILFLNEFSMQNLTNHQNQEVRQNTNVFIFFLFIIILSRWVHLLIEQF